MSNLQFMPDYLIPPLKQEFLHAYRSDNMVFKLFVNSI